jgi:hypothetical protein
MLCKIKKNLLASVLEENKLLLKQGKEKKAQIGLRI